MIRERIDDLLPYLVAPGTAREIAERCGRSKDAVGGTLRRLESRGKVKRGELIRAARVGMFSTIWEITDKGKKALDNLRGVTE